jgi:hypothetical protein
MSQYRHGDVMVEEVGTLPENRRKAQHTILAHGELTGHCHRIVESGAAVLFDTPDGMFLNVTAKEATLVHDEHDAIKLPTGYYRVWRQREYTPTEIRTIRD